MRGVCCIAQRVGPPCGPFCQDDLVRPTDALGVADGPESSFHLSPVCRGMLTVFPFTKAEKASEFSGLPLPHFEKNLLRGVPPATARSAQVGLHQLGVELYLPVLLEVSGAPDRRVCVPCCLSQCNGIVYIEDMSSKAVYLVPSTPMWSTTLKSSL